MYSLHKVSVCAMALACALFFAPVSASALGVGDIAVVNIQQIMRDSKAAAAARNQLTSRQKQYQEEIGKQETALQKEDQDIAKQRSVLSQEAFEKRVKEFREKATQTQKSAREKSMALRNAYGKAQAEIQKAVFEIIDGLAKEKGFKLAIPASQTLHFDNSLDITNEVLARLNKKLPDMKVQF